MEAVVTTIGASMIPMILEPMVERAGTMIVDQWESMVKIKSEINDLQNTLHLIKGVIQDAEEKQIQNIHIRDWLRQLVDIGYEARDVLDDFFTSSASIRAKRASRTVKFNFLPSCFSLSSFNVGSSSSTVSVALPFRLRSQLASDIRGVRVRLDAMMRQKEIVSILCSVGGPESVPMRHRPQIGPFVNKHKDLFVGREEVKDEIMNKLLYPNDNDVHLVPIWGMGGIGKTTLAQSIYNDKTLKEEDYPSKNRRWLCVGEKNFNAKGIIMSMIEEPYNSGVDHIQKKLVEKFKGDKFLIVLDDMWHVDSTEWKLLWDPLTHVGKGGVIIITTRIREAITATNTPVSNYLGPLSDEDCWLIFKDHAFVDENSDHKLGEKLIIGREIVKKLKGLPLAAQVVGRSLLNEPNVKTWRNFLEAQEWMQTNNEDDVMPALRWSYNRLPRHLKQCFAYCALFPKDHVFDEKVLIEMWMAHDLIQNIRGGEPRRPEDIGAQYFKELVHSSLFQCADNEYVMHDTIHDLALLVSNEEFARAKHSLSIDQMEKVRHITIIPDDDYSDNLSLCTSERILTLYTTSWDWNVKNTTHFKGNVLLELFKQWKSIRVLVLSHKRIVEIPDCISELKLLRYLDTSQTCIKDLPNSLCDLHNLQTLAAPLDACLPKNIVNMVSLRHLRANLSTYKGIAKLTSLQELSCVSVCDDGNIGELENLRELRGKMKVKGLRYVTSREDADLALMKDKMHIDQLTLDFCGGLEIGSFASPAIPVNEIEILDALQCPPNLTHLKISYYDGHRFPNWMINGNLIANLQTLKLHFCVKLEFLPPLGELNSLKQLSLRWMHEIEGLGDELYGKGMNEKVFFPSLESLYLDYMNKWKEWNGILIKDTSLSFFPCLTEMIISDCPELVSALPPNANFMRSLSSLKMFGCRGQELLQLDSLVSLKYLNIHNCSSLTHITSAVHFATTIEDLSISSCEKLEIMEFEKLLSLRRLEIKDCNKLISVTFLAEIKILVLRRCRTLRTLSINFQARHSVEVLEIDHCPLLELIFEEGSTPASSSLLSLVSLPLPRLQDICTTSKNIFAQLLDQDLTYLKKVFIHEVTRLEYFSETEENNLYKLTSLEDFSVSSCKYLQSLPSDFQKLSSLESLEITCCPQLQSLPAGGLPLSLQRLKLSYCPLLYERCKDESGLDWHKIKHIRERDIRKYW